MPDNKKITGTIAPYIPFKTFVTFIQKLHETNAPSVIDRSVFPTMSGSVRSQLMSTLRFTGLIDSQGTVQSNLLTIVNSYNTEAWTETISKFVFDAYADIIGDVNLDNGTAAQLREAFRERGSVDKQVLDKAVRFYLAALDASGVTYSPHFKVRQQRTGRPRKSKSTKKKGKSEETGFRRFR